MSVGKNRCGIYVIEQTGAGRLYIGSSVDIEHRWYSHRVLLNAGRHHSPRLQRAWSKHGAGAFRFSVLEECERDKLALLAREQEYLDVFSPVFNVCPTAGSPLGRPVTDATLAKLRQFQRARSAGITHCPKGHLYDDANTGHNGKGKGKRFCRACNALRVSAVYAAETSQQREARRQTVKAHYEANRPRINAQMREYAATRKDKKREYDQQRRERLKEIAR